MGSEGTNEKKSYDFILQVFKQKKSGFPGLPPCGQRHLGVSIHVPWDQRVLPEYEELFSLPNYILLFLDDFLNQNSIGLPPVKCFAMCL
jgi:hypothetical protein